MFVSYAQNYEDVALWRALKHVENGFYVDLGAQHPVIDSVSRAFYERGWRGVHVEPVPHYADLIRADRPNETVVQKAIGATRGRSTLHIMADSGLSTLSEDSAKRAESMLNRPARSVEVEIITLDDLYESIGKPTVHWLKVDVEGFEKDALTGWDAKQFRPWVIVVEATLPNSQIPNHHDWEPLILARNYAFVYFDGLNRFYVANEHPELAEALQKPPTVFDGFISHELARKDGEITELRRKLSSELRMSAAQGADQTEADLARDELQAQTNRYRWAIFTFEREGNGDRPLGGAAAAAGHSLLRMLFVGARKGITLLKLLVRDPALIPILLRRHLNDHKAAKAARSPQMMAEAGASSPYRFWLDRKDPDVASWQKRLSGMGN